MKNNSKGFAPILIILIVLVLLGGVYYLGTLKNKPSTVSMIPTSTPVILPLPTVKPVINSIRGWRTYSGKTFSFQYPNSWSDATATQLSTRTEVVSDGNLVVDDGAYYNKVTNKPETYEEYVTEVVPSDVKTQEYNLGNLTGIRYVQEDNAGRTVVNIILSDLKSSTRIFSIIYLSPVADEATISSILDPVLSTFKFTQ